MLFYKTCLVEGFSPLVRPGFSAFILLFFFSLSMGSPHCDRLGLLQPRLEQKKTNYNKTIHHRWWLAFSGSVLQQNNDNKTRGTHVEDSKDNVQLGKLRPLERSQWNRACIFIFYICHILLSLPYLYAHGRQAWVGGKNWRESQLDFTQNCRELRVCVTY